MKKFALLSVSDRTGLPNLAAALSRAGYTLLATSGTGKALDEAQIPWTSVESYTGLAELLDGRVKTLILRFMLEFSPDGIRSTISSRWRPPRSARSIS